MVTTTGLDFPQGDPEDTFSNLNLSKYSDVKADMGGSAFYNLSDIHIASRDPLTGNLTSVVSRGHILRSVFYKDLLQSATFCVEIPAKPEIKTEESDAKLPAMVQGVSKL